MSNFEAPMGPISLQPFRPGAWKVSGTVGCNNQRLRRADRAQAVYQGRVSLTTNRSTA